MKIILIRHGETTWNIEGRYQGQEDTPLSERGRKQDAAEQHRFKGLERNIIFQENRRIDGGGGKFRNEMTNPQLLAAIAALAMGGKVAHHRHQIPGA